MPFPVAFAFIKQLTAPSAPELIGSPTHSNETLYVNLGDFSIFVLWNKPLRSSIG